MTVSDSDKNAALRRCLALGYEQEYHNNRFFRRGVDILSLVLMDMIRSLASRSDSNLEAHELMVKEMQEKSLYINTEELRDGIVPEEEAL